MHYRLPSPRAICAHKSSKRATDYRLGALCQGGPRAEILRLPIGRVVVGRVVIVVPATLRATDRLVPPLEDRAPQASLLVVEAPNRDDAARFWYLQHC
jgi:hypothetical protein